jgi:hypothetical protein
MAKERRIMYGARKPFSRALHQSNDPQSRKIVIEYFKRQGLSLNENTNPYGVDLVSADGSVQMEIEHRLPWADDDFPFSEVNVPERKAKFLREGKAQYVILSRDYSHMGVIEGKDIMPFIVDNNLQLNRNKFVKDGEFFYKVPVTKFTWIKI